MTGRTAPRVGTLRSGGAGSARRRPALTYVSLDAAVGFLARRMLGAVFALWATSGMVFLLVRVATPDAARVLGGPRASAETLELIRHGLGLDQPLFVQYLRFVQDLLGGDLGRSYINGTSVGVLIAERLPTTVILVAGAAVLWLAGGAVLGVLAATRSGADRVLTLLLPIGLSVPAFVLGMVLLSLLFDGLGDLGIRLVEPGPPLQEHFWKRMILPWLTLALLQLATYTRLTRSAMLDVLHADYVRTARAKGLSERRVVYGHGLRAALMPMAGQLGVDLGALLGGSVVIEKVFGLQGVGQLVVDSITQGDAPVIIGVVLLSVTAVVLAGLLADLAYTVIDPRVRLH